MKKVIAATALLTLTVTSFANCMTAPLLGGCNADQWNAYNQQQQLIRQQQETLNLLQQQQLQTQQPRLPQPVTCYPNGFGGYVCQ